MLPRRYLMFKEKYIPLILSGKKRISIRRRTRLNEGDRFLIHGGGKVWGIGRVVRVEKKRMEELDERYADMEGMSYEEFRKELQKIYGKRNPPLYVIHFEVERVFNPPLEIEKKFYGELSPWKIAELSLREDLPLDGEARRILQRLVELKSIRKVAMEMGGLGRRGKVRAIVRKAYEMLRERGII